MEQIETDDQVILWDNGDDEATGQILEKLKVDWPGLQVFRSETNLGFAGGNNAAAKLANTGADLLLLNPDAVLKPGAVQAMRSALSAAADVAAVGARRDVHHLARSSVFVDRVGGRWRGNGWRNLIQVAYR